VQDCGKIVVLVRGAGAKKAERDKSGQQDVLDCSIVGMI